MMLKDRAGLSTWPRTSLERLLKRPENRVVSRVTFHNVRYCGASASLVTWISADSEITYPRIADEILSQTATTIPWRVKMDLAPAVLAVMERHRAKKPISMSML